MEGNSTWIPGIKFSEHPKKKSLFCSFLLRLVVEASGAIVIAFPNAAAGACPDHGTLGIIGVNLCSLLGADPGAKDLFELTDRLRWRRKRLEKREVRSERKDPRLAFRIPLGAERLQKITIVIGLSLDLKAIGLLEEQETVAKGFWISHLSTLGSWGR